ncbi:MAG: coproporphyrinogen oxidase [Deltaproteobacteria bacterium]|nr:coproporphyrinogen oxidase [Deltaproteobacteria bacterium]
MSKHLPQSAIPDSLSLAHRALPAGLYLHIPFCLSKCPYCGFYSVVNSESTEAFVNALTEEVKAVATPLPPLLSTFDTIYFGGGTPSILRIEQLENILNYIHKYFKLTSDIEITFETNPGDVEFSYLKDISGLGINRLNLGIQSFDDRILGFLGRRHTAAQAREAIKYARQSGFKNLGLDLIYGTPHQEIDSWMETLGTAVTYSPEHLSCYELTIEENTPFALKVQKGMFALPDEETQREFFIRTSEFLEARGYIHYEVSNFARGEAYLSRHNQKYWDHTPYLGIGPSAHSFNGSQRWWNHRSIGQYIAAITEGSSPIESFEDLTPEQRMMEEIFFGMRTRKGINLKRFRAEFQVDLELKKGKTLSLLEQEGLITIQKGVLSPTRTGLAVADTLALL